MDEKQKEIMVIAQEECAEVIQQISKIFRFGIDNQHKSQLSHRNVLEIEIGDLLCMIDLMIENKIVDKTNIEKGKDIKIEKLKKWSNIFK